MTMSTKCTEISSEFPLYVGGELESTTVERVERHVKQCASCREALGRAMEVRGAVLDYFKNGEEFQVRHSIWPEVREALREEGLIAASDSPLAAAPSRWGRIYRLTGLAVAATLLFLLGSVAGRLAIDSGGEPVSRSGGGSGPGGGDAPIARVNPPASKILQPVAGRALTPVMAGERSMGEDAHELIGQPIVQPMRLGIPVNWSDGNRAATYAPEMRRPDGVE